MKFDYLIKIYVPCNCFKIERTLSVLIVGQNILENAIKMCTFAVKLNRHLYVYPSMPFEASPNPKDLKKMFFRKTKREKTFKQIFKTIDFPSKDSYKIQQHCLQITQNVFHKESVCPKTEISTICGF